jgi:hypothetical protein
VRAGSVYARANATGQLHPSVPQGDTHIYRLTAVGDAITIADGTTDIVIVDGMARVHHRADVGDGKVGRHGLVAVHGNGGRVGGARGSRVPAPIVETIARVRAAGQLDLRAGIVLAALTVGRRIGFHRPAPAGEYARCQGITGSAKGDLQEGCFGRVTLVGIGGAPPTACDDKDHGVARTPARPANDLLDNGGQVRRLVDRILGPGRHAVPGHLGGGFGPAGHVVGIAAIKSPRVVRSLAGDGQIGGRGLVLAGREHEVGFGDDNALGNGQPLKAQAHKLLTQVILSQLQIPALVRNGAVELLLGIIRAYADPPLNLAHDHLFHLEAAVLPGGWRSTGPHSRRQRRTQQKQHRKCSPKMDQTLHRISPPIASPVASKPSSTSRKLVTGCDAGAQALGARGSPRSPGHSFQRVTQPTHHTAAY